MQLVCGRKHTFNGGHKGKNDPQDQCHGGHFPKRPSGPVSWGTLSKTTLRTSVMRDTRARMTLRTSVMGDTFQNDPQDQCHGGHFPKRPSAPVSWGKNDPQDQCHGARMTLRTSVMGDTFQNDPQDQCHGGHKGKNDPQDQCHGGHFPRTTLSTSVMGQE